jgi:hypothetical protein
MRVLDESPGEPPGGGRPRATSRAVVYLAWGDEFVARATASARSAERLGAPRILLTDEAHADAARGSGAFEIVRALDVEHWDHQLKSRLLEFIPPGFDSLLYLDADTVVLHDISFGFQKAEQHGIAISPAPKYNLAHYKGFDRVLAANDIEVPPQLVYNAGVIFFRLTTEVRAVFERWRGLCDTLGRPLGYLQDQPFLALAIEQCGFNPYVLPPVYNYRGNGEVAVGDVLLWHSHHPVPDDLNVYEGPDFRRRYLNGVRAPYRA